MKRGIAILGSTGSIGTQTLEVIREHSDRFQVEVLTAQNNADLLIEQAKEFLPNAVVIVNESLYDQVNESLDKLDIKVFAGANALKSVVEFESVHIVLTALVGYSGLLPTIKAIEAGKTIALANKETLVVAGGLLKTLAREKGVKNFSVDLEDLALFLFFFGGVSHKN